MRPFPVTVRCLALAGLGFGALPAFAQSANVTAFNPYNGVGTSAGPAPTAVYAMPQGAPAGGMAFNPWNAGGVAATPSYAPSANVQAGVYGRAASYDPGSYSPGTYGSGANLPSPPPGPIESRLVAVPQRPDRSTASTQAIRVTPTPTSAPPPPAEAVVTRAEPMPAPVPVAAPPRAPTPLPITAAAPAPVPTPAPAPPPAPRPAPVAAAAPAPVVAAPPPARPAAVASVTPPAPEPAAPRVASTIASVPFSPQSAEINGIARAELDRVAQSSKGVRAIELRAYAGGTDPTEARKIALARALSVRSYLIDQGVRARIEVGAFASSNTSGASERVDVLGP